MTNTNDSLIEAVNTVLEQAPCNCPHAMRYDRGEHLSGCFLFDLNLAAIQSAQTKAQQAVEYKPGDWYMAKGADDMQRFFRSRLPAIREAARECGYAIGVHGSERRDFDLIAMPWREDAAEPDALAHAIAKAACGLTRAGAYDWEEKPAGRVAVSLPICWTDDRRPSAGHIDLSVIAALASKQAPPEWTPEMSRAVQLYSELGAYAASNLSGAYGLFEEFWNVAHRAALASSAPAPTVKDSLTVRGVPAPLTEAKAVATLKPARRFYRESASVLAACAAGRDGDCIHSQCPQLRDGEPEKTGRHCPLDGIGLDGGV